MRKVVVTEFMTLDGVIENPQWTVPYWNDEIASFKQAELFAADAQLLGRVTYEGFAAAWPDQTDEEGFADRMNSMPKYVVSTTLDKAEWTNSTIIRDDVAEAIRTLKQQPGENILVGGSATLIQWLIAQDLVDEYHLLVYPVTLGQGIRLFQNGSAVKLKLVQAQPYSSGVVGLIYTPDRSS